MAGYEVITKMTLKDTIAEVKEFAKAINEFADTLEQIEKKYADDIPQENIRNCKTCERSKDGHSAGTEDCHLCMWESQYKPKKAQETVTEFADRCRECGKMKRCKDCKFFEYDSWANVDGIPLIVAHEICSKWGEGCKTNENGYCFLFEQKEDEK